MSRGPSRPNPLLPDFFIADMIGPGIVGHWVAPGERNIPDPTEYLKVDGSRIKPRNGRISFRFAEVMEELTYLDHVRLIAVDHPGARVGVQARVVAQDRRVQHRREQWVVVGGHLAAVARDLAVRRIAHAGDLAIAVGERDQPGGELVACERARLVGANDVDAAERLDRGQTAHDRAARGHPAHADGEDDGDHGRQSLGDRRNGEPDRGEEHLVGRVVAQQRASRECRRGEGQDPHALPRSAVGGLHDRSLLAFFGADGRRSRRWGVQSR